MNKINIIFMSLAAIAMCGMYGCSDDDSTITATKNNNNPGSESGSAPTCSDGVMNGDETGIDCGGSCSICAEDYIPGTCTDNEKNADETDVDCGGSCNRCTDNRHCKTNSDCRSGKCELNICKSSNTLCSDNTLSGDETDIDCGGSCNTCADGKICKVNADCMSNKCENNICQPKSALCADGTKSGDETDIDCGGSCNRCTDGKACLSDNDCNGFCNENICTSCNDGVMNGNEAGIDCGGRCGATCAPESHCNSDNDCESYNCINSICKTTDCPDKAEAGEIIINEVFANPNTEEKMAHSNNNQMKFIELYNKSNKTLQLYNLSLKYNDNEIHAKGCISGQKYLIIHPSGQELTALDIDAQTLASDNIEASVNAIAGNVSLINRADNTVIHSALVPETAKGVSAGRDKPEDSSTNDEPMVPHSSIHPIESNVKNDYSPGLPNNAGFPMG